MAIVFRPSNIWATSSRWERTTWS